MRPQIKSYFIFYNHENQKAKIWAKKIASWINKNHANTKKDSKKPNLLIILGGDGTILKGAREFERCSPKILALNLGRVGFLASVRDNDKFLKYIKKFFDNDYILEKRNVLEIKVLRNKKEICREIAINEVAIQNPLGMVELTVKIEGHPVQAIRGTGILVSTPTGSTAFNLSAHGPIVMPSLECVILTELLDHNLPTPSLVIPKSKKVFITINDFREHKLLSVSSTGEPADVLISADSKSPTPLKKNDVIVVDEHPHPIKLISFDEHYFLKSIQDKFSFK
jgi:NAD+ kinase